MLTSPPWQVLQYRSSWQTKSEPGLVINLNTNGASLPARTDTRPLQLPGKVNQPAAM